MLFTEISVREVPHGGFGLRSQEFLFGWLIVILLPMVADLPANAKGKGKFPENID